MTPHKSLLCLALLSIALSSAAQKYKGDSWAQVSQKGSGTLTIVYFEEAGLIQKGPDGNMKGLCVDILNDFADYVQNKHKKKITINYAGNEPLFSNFLSISQNTPDILGVTNTAITEERKQIMKYSPPFMRTPLVLFTSADAATVNDLPETKQKLAGFTAITIKGSTHEKQLLKLKKEHLPDLEITYGASESDILKKLSAGKKMLTVLDLIALNEAKRKKLAVKMHRVKFGKPEDSGFIMSKTTDWDIPLREFLTEEYLKSPQYRRNIVDNVGADFLGI